MDNIQEALLKYKPIRNDVAVSDNTRVARPDQRILTTPIVNKKSNLYKARQTKLLNRKNYDNTVKGIKERLSDINKQGASVATYLNIRRQLEADAEKRRIEQERLDAINKRKASYQIQNDFANSKEAEIAASNVFTNPLLSVAATAEFFVRNAVGYGVDSSTKAHASSITGRISDQDQAVFEAEARKLIIEAETNIKNLTRQRDLHEETNGKDDVYYQFLKQIKENIDKLNNDPQLQQLNEAYKERYIDDRLPWYKKIFKFFTDNDNFGDKEAAKENYARMYQQYSSASIEKELVNNIVNSMDPNQVISMVYGKTFIDYLKTKDKSLQQEYLRNAKEKLSKDKKLVLSLYAEQNPDYFLDGEIIPKRLRALEQFKPGSEGERQYKIALAKERILNGNYGKKTASELYDSEDMDLESQYLQANSRIKEAEKTKEELQNEYVRTMKFQKDASDFFLVAEGYKKMAQAHQHDSLLNPMYYLYVMPGTIGSSNSSPEQMIGNVIQYGSLAGGQIGSKIGTVASIPFQLKGALDENYGEQAETYLERLKDSIGTLSNNTTQKGENTLLEDLEQKSRKYWKEQGMDQKWINDHCDTSSDEGIKNILADCANGLISTNDPRFRKLKLNGMIGLHAQRDANNMRTVGSLPFQVSMQLLPVERMFRSATKFIFPEESKILSKQLVNQVESKGGKLVTNTERQQVAVAPKPKTGKYENGFNKPYKSATDAFLEGFETGSEAAEVLFGSGIAGNIAGGILYGSIKASGHMLSKALPDGQRALVEQMSRQLAHKYMNVYDKLLSLGSKKALFAKYGIPASKRIFANSISEGTEEGVQYLNSQKDFSEYGFGGMSLGDMIVNDLSQGRRVREAYMSLLGLGDSELKNDVEFWDNVKGGFALGGGHVGIILTVNSVLDGYNQHITDQLILNSSIFNRNAQSISRANNKAMSMAVMRGGEHALEETLNDMESRDRNRETPQFSQEDYDEKRKQIKLIVQLTKNNTVRGILKAHGIEYGTEEYATAIADQQRIMQSKQDNEQESNELLKRINSHYNSKEYQDAIDQSINSLFSDIKDRVLFSVSRSKFINKYAEERLGEKRENETDEQYEERRQKLLEEGEKVADQNLKNNVKHKSLLVDMLNALYALKAQQNSIDSWFELGKKFGLNTQRPDAKLIKKNIDRQIDEIKSTLVKQYKDEFQGFDIKSKSDAEILNFINGLSGLVRVGDQDEVTQMHKAAAMLSADAELLERHNNRFLKGIVQNEDGSFEYNPAKWLYKRDLSKQIEKSIKEGKKIKPISFEESGYSNRKSDKNPYKDRISAIMKADTENENLDWLVSDIYNGDAITDLLEKETPEFDNNVIDTTDKSLVEEIAPVEQPLTTNTTPVEQSTETSGTIESRRKKSRLEASKRAARKHWNKKLKERRAKRRGRMYADITGIGKFTAEMITDLAMLLIKNAQIAYYSFKEFIEDIKDITEEDVNDSSFINPLKQFYIKLKLKYSISNPEASQNMSSNEEVIQYGNSQQIDTELLASPETKNIDELYSKTKLQVVEEISNFYDLIVGEGENAKIYTNHVAIELQTKFSKDKYLQLLNSVTEALKSEESFNKFIKEHNLPELFSKYRNTPKINEVIARHIVNKEELTYNGLKRAKLIRLSVIDYLKTKIINPLFLDRNIFPQDQIDAVISRLDIMRKFIADHELRMLDTDHMLCGKNSDGNNTAVQADILLVNPKGEIYIWDVVSTIYQKDVLNKRNSHLHTINYNNNKLNNKQVYDVLYNIFGNNCIKQVKIILIGYDVEHHSVNVYNSINISQDEINSTQYRYDNTELLDSRRKDLLDKINSAIDDITELITKNNLTTQVNLNKEVYNPSDTAQEAYDDLSRLEDRLTDLDNEHDALVNESDSSNTIQEQEEYWDTFFLNLGEDLSEDEEYAINLVNNFSALCKDIDITVSNTNIIGRVINAKDRAAIETLINKLTEAQLMLNEILNNKYSLNIDLTSETQLILSAMEDIHKLNINNDQYTTSKIGRFKEWWLTKFVSIDPNRTIARRIASQKYLDVNFVAAAYVNKIANVVDSLSYIGEDGRSHIFDDIVRDTQLLMWYGTLLNNYFAQLLDNADIFINNNKNLNADVIASFNNVIAQGHDLIDKFELRFLLKLIPRYKGPATSELEEINRIYTGYLDLYNRSTAVHLPFGEIDNYSTPEKTRKNGRYRDVSNYADFVENSEFELFEDQDGDIAIKITYDPKSPQQFVYKFVEKYTFDKDLYNEQVKPFIEKVRRMLEYKKTHPNAEIKFVVSRNKGSFLYDTQKTHRITDFLLTGFNMKRNEKNENVNEDFLYTATISSESGFGILKTIQTQDDTSLNIYTVATGDKLNLSLGLFDDVYAKQKLYTRSGSIVFKFDTGKKEPQSLKNRYMFAVMDVVPFGKEIGSKLRDLLVLASTGTQQIDGYNIIDLLKMCMYIKDKDLKLTEYNNTNWLINIQHNEVIIGSTKYNTTTEDGRQALLNAVQNMLFVIDKDNINQYFSSWNNSIMRTAKNIFSTSDVNEIILPNGLKLTRNDFVKVNYGKPTGTTFFGYLLRNNFIVTKVQRLKVCQINIDNLHLEEKGLTPKQELEEIKPQGLLTEKQISEIEESSNKQSNFDSMFENLLEKDDKKSFDEEVDDMFNGLLMTNDGFDIADRSSIERQQFVEDVENYFKKVLGENGKVKWSTEDKKHLGTLGNNVILGECETAFIQLSQYAPKSAAFHEAFHKVIELILSDSERESLYRAYREKYGSLLSDRDVAEGLCDIFVDFANIKEKQKDGLFGKVKGLFKFVLKTLGMYITYGVKNTNQIIRTVNNTQSGKYANKKISQDKKDRFNKLFGKSLHYTVKNTDTGQVEDFDMINNMSEVREIAKALSYFIIRLYDANNVTINLKDFKIDKLTPSKLLYPKTLVGNVINRLILRKDTRAGLIFNEIFTGEDYTSDEGETYKVYPKFNVLTKYINEYMSSILSAYDGKFKDEDEEQTDEDAVLKTNIDRFDKASYEFSKLDSATKQAKLFFATIPYSKFNSQGRPVLDTSNNMFGLPSFMPIEETYNIITNDLNHVKTPEELYNELQKKSFQDPMYKVVFDKFKKIYDSLYTFGDDGRIIIDYDAEATITQLFMAIKGLKLDFTICMSETDANNNKTTRVISSQFNQDSRLFPSTWSSYLLGGVVDIFSSVKTENGNLQFKPNGLELLRKSILTLNRIKVGIGMFGDININDETYNFEKNSDVEKVKDLLITTLNSVGVMILKKALNRMLLNKYGSLGKDAIVMWLNSSGVDSINTFISYLVSIEQKGTINQKAAQKGYANTGFVKELGNAQGEYNRNTKQNMSLALGGKKLYNQSQNHSISYMVGLLQDALTNKDNRSKYILTLLNFSYCTYNDGIQNNGSIVLRAVQQSNSAKFKLCTYTGFLTDNKGDTGTDFKSEPTVEDYIAKMTMLQQGSLIFPTLADKGTWVYMNITGDKNIRIPGMTYDSTYITDKNGKYVYNDDGNKVQELTATNVPIANKHYIDKNGKKVRYLVPCDEVLDQMIQYARCEFRAIQECMEDLGYESIPHYVKQGRTVIPKEHRIKNYHTENKGKGGKKTEPNGTRFLSLTRLYVPYVDKDNKVRINEINLNDPNKSSAEMLNVAYNEFFSKSLEEQKLIMALVLYKQTESAIKNALKLNIIEQDKETGFVKNKSLNQNQINAIKKEFLKNHPKIKDVLSSAEIESLAIHALLGDVTNRSIISSEEFERLFSGHPGMYKVTYNYTKGIIKNSTADKQKRIGGLVSTGDDNRLDLWGVKETYTCAELKDWEVGSTADIMDNMEDLFINSELNDVYADYDRGNNKEKQLYDYNYTNEELKKLLPKEYYDNAVNRAKKYAESYRSGINVADGAAYITEDMCKLLLRLRGAYSNDIKKAFETINSKNNSWKTKAEAYKFIYENLNSVTTKYTAFGTRPLNYIDENGQYQESPVAVPYYNKFALFPLFKATTTGPMNNLYEKMLKEQVDMLMMDSAVKLGSQGTIPFNGISASAPFNKYQQSLGFLRRQLNTDPEEEHIMNMGTLAVKIVLTNLVLDRVYPDGRTGELIRNSIMDSILALAVDGVKLFRDDFYNEEGEIDNDKLTKYLVSQLNSRNANRSLIEVLDANMPIAATSESSWIESIILSKSNKDIIDIKLPGNSFVQRSVFAIENENGEGSIKGSDFYNGLKLLMINEEDSMDCVISLDYFEEILPKGLSPAEQRQFLIDNKIIGPDAKANIMAYRIPTQAQSSIHALRVIDVLPIHKATIILPLEFTKITGSDFDIDHLYLTCLNYNKIKSPKHTGRKSWLQEEKYKSNYVLSTYFDETDPKYHQNKLLNEMLTLLKDVNHSMNSLYKSIDNDTDLAHSVADEVQDVETDQHLSYNFDTLHEQVNRRNDFITGKTGISPFALNVVSQVMTQIFNVGMSFQNHTINRLGLGLFFERRDVEGNTILSWESALLNAEVDIVKDPWVSKLNVGSFTYNLLNFLIRSGYGKAGLRFCKQPVIVAMSNASENYSSQYTKDKYNRVNRNDAILNAAKEYLGIEIPNNTTWIFNRINMKTGKNKYFGDDCIEYVLYMLNKPEDVKVNQEKVFYAYWALVPFISALNSLVLYTKIDTKKHGKTFAETITYWNGYDKLLLNRLFNEKGLLDLVHKSWINYKTENAIFEPIKVMLGQSFGSNLNVINVIIEFANTLTSDENPNVSSDVIKTLMLSFATAIKSEFFNKFAKQSGIKIKQLFVGDRSVAIKLDRLKYLIKNDDRFKHLESNALLNALTTTTKPDRGPILRFIYLNRPIDNGRIEEDPLIDAWEDLFNDKEPSIRKFAKELAIYSFVTSGEYKGMFTKLLKFLPPSFILGRLPDSTVNGQSYAEFIQNKLLDIQRDEIVKSLEDMLDYIAVNNSDDYKMIPRVNLSEKDENGKTVSAFDYVTNPTNPNVPVVLITKNMKHANNRYVCIRNKIAKNNYRYNVYKRTVLVKKYSDLEGYKLEYVYILLPNKGYHGRHDGQKFDIYEYGGNYGFDFNAANGITMEKFNKILHYVDVVNDSGIVSMQDLTDDRFNRFMLERMLTYQTDDQIKQDLKIIRKAYDPDYEEETASDDINFDVKKDLAIAKSSKMSDLEEKAREVSGVITTRIQNTNKHFGNPFSHYNYNGVSVVLENVQLAVKAYEDWLRGTKYQDIEPERRQWILDQINSGLLDNRPLVYYTNSVKDTDGINKIYDYDTFPNHAHILLKLINERNKSTISEPTSTENVQYVNHSGGAIGSDTVWGQIGEQYGVKSNHYYNNLKTPNGNVQISQEDVIEGQQKVTKAAIQLGRLNPRFTVKDDRLIRNWSQVKYSDKIIAIGTMLKPGEKINNNPNDARTAAIASVKGGTGYAVQMAINEGKPVYVYDQIRKQWYKNISGKWEKSEVPTLTPNFAGIGTREINQDGVNAIKSVYEKTFNNKDSKDIIKEFNKKNLQQDNSINELSNLGEQRKKECE